MVDKFEVLSDREHVLKRSGVYLGSTSCEPLNGIIDFKYQQKLVVPALVKMFEEIVQNCLEVYIKSNGQYANKIDITIKNTKKGTEITVSDNGYGIPVVEVGDHGWQPVLAWTALRAGSNFDDSKREGASANGMGSALVNIFSKSFNGTTCDGKKKCVVTCSNNMETINFVISKTTKKGTTVEFIPDLERLGLTEFSQDHLDVIKDRLINFSILYPDIKFTFNDQPLHGGSRSDIAAKFHTNAFFSETDKVFYVIAPSGTDEEFRYVTCVNGIWMKSGGVHIDQCANAITTELIPQIKRKWKIDVPSNQIKQHLLIGIWVKGFPNPKFESQTKERLTNTISEVKSFFNFEQISEKIAKHIIKTPEFIDPIIQAILFKKEQADNLALARAQKQIKKVRIVNHIAAQSDNPDERTLFLTEGLSSIGLLLQVRDPMRVGGYSLRGTPLNVYGMKPSEIIKNKEISEVMNIIGLEFNKSADNLNYNRICVLSDMDPDGGKIFSLLINFFSRWPELFTNKRIYRALSPLYICTRGKTSKWFYSQNEYDQFDSTNYDVQYFKGLGGLSEEVYSEVINNPRLVEVTMDDIEDINKLIMAFSDDAQGRKNWLQQ